MPRGVYARKPKTHCKNGHPYGDNRDRLGFLFCVVCREARRQERRSSISRRTAPKSENPTEYIAWSNMKQRCLNPKHPSFFLYGGRGIQVCDRWKNSFEDFLADVGKRPFPELSLDRYPDMNGNYEPGNVRWATIQEQAENRNPLGTFRRFPKEHKEYVHRYQREDFLEKHGIEEYPTAEQIDIMSPLQCDVMLLSCYGYTFEEIGGRLGFTRQRAQQIQAEVLQILTSSPKILSRT